MTADDLTREEVTQWALSFQEHCRWRGRLLDDTSSSWLDIAQSFDSLLRKDESGAAAAWLKSFLSEAPAWQRVAERLSETSGAPFAESCTPAAFLAYLRSKDRHDRPDDLQRLRPGSEYLTQEQVGARIAELRRDRGVSQRRLADAVEVDPSAISRIESGERGLAINELIAIASFLGVETDALLRRRVDSAPLFRNEGGDAEGNEALAAFETIVDDFFAFDAAVRR